MCSIQKNTYYNVVVLSSSICTVDIGYSLVILYSFGEIPVYSITLLSNCPVFGGALRFFRHILSAVSQKMCQKVELSAF